MIRATALVLLLALSLLVPSGPVDAAKPDKWDKRLQNNDASAVFRTIVNIGKSGNLEAATALIRNGLEYKHAHLSVACGEALRALPQEPLVKRLMEDKEFVKWWRKAAKEKDTKRAMNLSRMLGTWGHRMVDPVMAHLAGGRRTPEAQAEALFMAGSLRGAQRFPKTQDAILGALAKGRTETIKCAACSAAGRWRGSVFLDGLERIVKRDQDPYAGLYAVWAMRQIGWDRGISSFIHVVTKNPKKTTKQANLKAIAELCRLRDVEDLLSLTRDRREELRDAAVLGLARLAWRSTHRKFVKQPPPGEEPAAVTGAPPPKKDPTKHELPKPELDIPEEVIDRFIQIVREDSSFLVRDAARQGLIRWGERAHAKVVATMPGLIDFSNQDASLTAIELCGLFGAKDSFDSLVKVAQFDDDRARRMFAARALEGIDPAGAVKKLVAAMRPRNREKDTELRAVRALGYVRHMDAFEALLKLATSPDAWSEGMRSEAEFALERLTGRRFGRKQRPWRTWLQTARNPLHPGIARFDRAKNRRDANAGGLYGLTGRTERAVEDGLRWLEQQQEPLGTWDGNARGFLGFVHCEPAYTGLVLLSYLGAGYVGSDGKYRELIRRATEYLAAAQFYDGGFPVTGGGDDSWIYAYSIAMAVWALNESYGLGGDDALEEPAQWGIDYLIRNQTPGAGWRYGPRNGTDTSCTSWVLMATKMAGLLGLEVAQKSWDGIDDWLERSSLDLTGEEERLEDISSDYDHEVGGSRKFKAFTSYFVLEGGDKRGLRRISMTSVGLVCRFFMGWQRGHPYMIGGSNLLMEFLPKWMQGLSKEQANTWYHYYWYYGTLAMHQMGGKFWRAWNQKIKRMYPDKQRSSPPELAGSWDADTNKLGGGRLFSTATAILTLETYYRFSPLFAQTFGEEGQEAAVEDQKAQDLEGLWK